MTIYDSSNFMIGGTEDTKISSANLTKINKELKNSFNEEEARRNIAEYYLATTSLLTPEQYFQGIPQNIITYVEDGAEKALKEPPFFDIEISGKKYTMPQTNLIGIMYSIFSTEPYNLAGLVSEIPDTYGRSERRGKKEIEMRQRYYHFISSNTVNTINRITDYYITYLRKTQTDINTYLKKINKPEVNLIPDQKIVSDDIIDELRKSMTRAYNRLLKKNKEITSTVANKYLYIHTTKGKISTPTDKLVTTLLDELVAQFQPIYEKVKAERDAIRNDKSLSIPTSNEGCACMSPCEHKKTGMFSKGQFCYVNEKHSAFDPKLGCDKKGIVGKDSSYEYERLAKCDAPIPFKQTAVNSAQSGGDGSGNDEFYKQKYMKYKQKYHELK